MAGGVREGKAAPRSLVTTLARGDSLARRAVELPLFASYAAMSSQIVKIQKDTLGAIKRSKRPPRSLVTTLARGDSLARNAIELLGRLARRVDLNWRPGLSTPEQCCQFECETRSQKFNLVQNI